MASPFAAVSFSFFLFSFLSFAQSSTIGVTYISRLLEIQDRERAPPSVQIAAAYGVLHRLLPSHSSSFEFGIVSKEQCGGDSCFMISNHPSSSGHGAPEILITGVTGVEIMAGLHWYLKYWCGSHISWDKTGGAQLLSVPDSGSFPHVQEAGILIQRPIPWNYYQNAVTSSYTFAWWDWKRWEKEIDWMALQGINLPLAFTGQEAIWQKVFRNFNISHLDLKDFFGGPAFLSWSRMGNLHGWGGPLPQSWLDQQLLLQKKILARMYELGMTPVLPAFSGNVPAALKYIFPSAKITRLGNWFTVGGNPRWCCTYLLDATDPLFIEIGRAFIQQQLKGLFNLVSNGEGLVADFGMTNGRIPDLEGTFLDSELIEESAWKNILTTDQLIRRRWNMNESAGHIPSTANGCLDYGLCCYPWLVFHGLCRKAMWSDTFDENTPPVDDPEYISSLGAAIFKGMQSGDSNAIWLMQGWLFSYDPFWRPPQMKALLHSVPMGRLVVLDLFAEVKPIWITSEQFYGVPYIWKLARFRLECDIDASRLMTEWYKEIRKTAVIRNSQMRNAVLSV
uniref:Alpha-N-acetylglucosaminidase n=1 Tax=Vitis vinifera TaxID=29760 RepID=A5BEA1_VITVI|nr:hypothetical protein VITISV_031934 [Vitis vinifera]